VYVFTYLQENVVCDFELNEVHLQCKKTPLTKHRDTKDAPSTVAAAATTTSTSTSEPAAETVDDLPDEIDADEKKTQ